MGKGITSRIRQLVYERDGGRCQVCQQKVNFDLFECGHIVDRVKGGLAILDNLVTMCLRCNKVKPRHQNRKEFDMWVQSGNWNKSKRPIMSESAISRFWFKTDRSEECWIWKGTLDPEGYGHFYPQSKYQGAFLAHRVSYFLRYGDIPIGAYVLHRCNNRACVNPDHLHLGSPKENMEGITFRAIGTPRKLTWTQVCEIRSSYDTDNITQKDLAKQYSVSRVTVGRIINQKSRLSPNGYQKPDRSRSPTENPLERLYFRIDGKIIKDNNDCWIWGGTTNRKCPVITMFDRNATVRKVLWERYIGNFPPRTRISNICGSELCVNPKHCELR